MLGLRRTDRTTELYRSASDSTGSSATSLPHADRAVRRPGEATSAAINRRQRIALLTRAIEDRIIPTMAVAHSAAASPTDTQADISDADVAGFTALILAYDQPACLAWMERLSAGGATMAQICIGLLTPAARRLGALWDEDLCSFVDVTAGVGMLQMLLQRLPEICRDPLPIRDAARTILLAGLPGEQHTFGLRMVADMFADAGWDVTSAPGISDAALARLVANQPFAIAGLAISADYQVNALAAAIRTIHRNTLNPNIGILIGGPILLAWPDLAPLVGADVTATDAKQAVLRAEGLRVLMTSLGPQRGGATAPDRARRQAADKAR